MSSKNAVVLSFCRGIFNKFPRENQSRRLSAPVFFKGAGGGFLRFPKKNNGCGGNEKRGKPTTPPPYLYDFLRRRYAVQQTPFSSKEREDEADDLIEADALPKKTTDAPTDTGSRTVTKFSTTR